MHVTSHLISISSLSTPSSSLATGTLKSPFKVSEVKVSEVKVSEAKSRLGTLPHVNFASQSLKHCFTILSHNHNATLMFLRLYRLWVLFVAVSRTTN